MKVTFQINKRLTPEERDILITGIPDEEWGALRQFFLVTIEETTQIAVSPEIVREHGLVAYYSGQVEAIRSVFGQLEDIRTRNKTIRDEDSIF